MRSDPRNRTVSIIDVVTLPDDKDHVLLVMPYLRVFDAPPFHCCSEVVEAFRQFLQGLEFLHEHNISHGDACLFNLMMDETRVVPRGSHFVRPCGHDGVNRNLTWRHRCTVAPVRYYYIDFGLSTWFPNGKESANATGVVGQIKDVPDFSASSYNPFKVDIYQLGRTILDVIKEYPELSIFIPFAENMTRPNPSNRPSAAEALAEFEVVASSLDRRALRARIWRYKDTFSERLFRLFHCIPAL